MVSLTLDEIARALGGEVTGQQALVPGPGHTRRDRSLSVKLSTTSLKGFVVHSYSGDDWRACEEHVAQALGLRLDHWRKPPEPDPIASMARRAARREAEERAAEEVANRQDRARAIWEQAVSPYATPVEAYLRGRALKLPDAIAGAVLRFHPRCPWGTGTAPAMIAPFRNVRTGEITGIHRTGLSSDGRKIGRKMLGIAAGAAIMLDPDEEVTLGLTIGEGIETCLSAWLLGLRPVWALGSVDAVRTFDVLPGIEGLTLLEETGDSGASTAATHQAATRWHRAGRSVEIITPAVTGDLNDALQAGGAAA